MFTSIRSILDYDWCRMPLGWVRKTSIAAISLMVAATATPSAAQEAGVINLRDITESIVPTSTNTGGRDFNGSPTVILDVQLSVGQRGRAIFANVAMTARRGRLRTFTTKRFMVWRWNPAEDIRTVQRVLTPGVTVRFDNLPKTCGFGCGRLSSSESNSYEQDGGLIVNRTVPGRGLVRLVRLMGDTNGDDISTDQNPHGDTAIYHIQFRPIRVEFSRGLGG